MQPYMLMQARLFELQVAFFSCLNPVLSTFVLMCHSTLMGASEANAADSSAVSQSARQSNTVKHRQTGGDVG